MGDVASLPDDTRYDLWSQQLRRCFDRSNGLFARQLRDGAWAPTLGTEAITSTAICLIGLDRAGLPVSRIGAPAAQLCRSIARHIRSQRYVGGIGLALWAASATRAMAAPELLAEAGLDPAGVMQAIPVITTMELAWLASGLLHADHPALVEQTRQALAALATRLGPTRSVFRHASEAAPLRHRLRGRVANFADQVYPLQALAFAAIARSSIEHRRFAERTAAHMIAAQGPLGQWWWHHDAVTGQVVERFPVYSVHQHSMAPMALRALAASGGTHHAGAIRRSRAWLGTNELGIDMRDEETGIIWRSIERREAWPAHMARRLRIAAARPGAEEDARPLRLNREMRPYEWGWLLYADAIDRGNVPQGHIV